MKWSFGICVGTSSIFIPKVIESIKKQAKKINEYEILLVGHDDIISKFKNKDTKLISFEESFKPGWITKKKNLIAQLAKFDNISIHHDYVSLDENWADGFLKFGNDWDVAMTRIENLDGTRFRDWVSWYDGQEEKTVQFLRYDDVNIDSMYVSGSYFCVKKNFLLQHPFNENLTWGEGEDVEWSKRIRGFWSYKMNMLSTVKMLKLKHKWPPNPDPYDAWFKEKMKEETK